MSYCIPCAGTGSQRAGAMSLALCEACEGSGCQHVNSLTKGGHCSLCEQDDHCLRCLNRRAGVREAVVRDMADNVTEPPYSDSPLGSIARAVEHIKGGLRKFIGR